MGAGCGAASLAAPVSPAQLRDVVACVAAPHDDLLRRFVADLRRGGLPRSRLRPAGDGRPLRITALAISIAAMNSSKPAALALGISSMAA